MDPYKVLGIAPGATDEEIKRAYRNLSRKYHPDANVNNPDRAQAEEKFKEVQMAYDQIMKQKQQGYSYGSGYGGGSYGYGGFGYGRTNGAYGNSGYGSRCIRLLLERFKDRKYIFEIEKQDEQAENSEDRKRRKAFYLRNGLKETGVFANVYQVDFELLTPEGNLTFEEYTDFLEHVLGKENLAKLNPVLLEEKS